jgi:hypothetical protein
MKSVSDISVLLRRSLTQWAKVFVKTGLGDFQLLQAAEVAAFLEF